MEPAPYFTSLPRSPLHSGFYNRKFKKKKREGTRNWSSPLTHIFTLQASCRGPTALQGGQDYMHPFREI